ncbi:RNA recognition domain-containing protein [Seiridium cupressi]
MDSRSPSRERYARSVTPRSRYSRSPSPARRRRSPSRSVTPPSRRNGRYRSGSRSRSRSWSRDRESRGRSESPLRGSTKIVVEKLTKNINEDHLREIFGQYGSIRDLDLPMNRQFNTNRGTAYILYVHEADAEAAIAHMHEAQLDGAVINVSIVLPRRKFSQSPPTASRGANIDPRVPAPGPRGGFAGGPRGPRGGGFGGPSFGGGPGGGRPRSPARFGGGRQGRGRDREANNYRPGTRSPSYSRSRSPPPRRGRSPSYDSRSRSPAPRRRGGGRRDSFDDRDTRRRSPSYDDYRSRSRSRGRDFR